MTVQTIFKVLIGTMALMVISALLVEIFNLQLTSLRLSSMTRLAASQSAELFAQESYKDEGGKRTTNMPSIQYSDGVDDAGNSYSGGEYLNGKIYDGSSPEEIWQNIYNSESYQRFSADLGDNWYSLGVFDLALRTQGNASASLPGWGALTQAQIDEYSKAMMANSFYHNMYTPLNIGIPYVGEYVSSGFDGASNHNSTLDRAFKWNLTQLLSNCNPDNIHKDANGNLYVMYSGFRCYTKDAEITKVTYEVFNVSDSSDASRFRTLTGIDPTGSVGNSQGLGIGDISNLTATTASGEDERQNICVAYIEYSLPVSYKGITPIKNIFEWVWKNEVQGMENSAPDLADQTWNDDTEDLTGGGEGNSTLPTSGKLIYYVVR